MSTLFFETALLPDGWHDDVRITMGDDGLITAIERGVARDSLDTFIKGAALPGMPNLHSHAFQRAMAGLTEVAGPAGDSFWTWREVMYDFVGKLTPEDAGAIAAQLYMEMLKAGYTSVAEFHYLHHQPGGVPYDSLDEMSDRVIGAANKAGIAITHLPVLYAYSGFGGAEPAPEQGRFLNDAGRYLELVACLNSQYKDDPDVRIGMAPHSLRAVTGELLQDVLTGASFLEGDAPIHIHIAEQTREVEESLAALGARPVEWLLDRFKVDQHWCLVHATHLTTGEIHGLAGSRAVAGLCPTTEANLGDGLFPARSFRKASGKIGIGTDSNTEIGVAGELRLLEYGQRLATRERNVLAGAEGRSPGRSLYQAAATGGAQALGIKAGKLEPDTRADIIVLDTEHPNLAGRRHDQILDSWIFGAGSDLVRDVFVRGAHVILDRRHPAEAEISAAFVAAIKRICP